MNEPILRYQHLYKAFGDHVVLRNITLDVHEHQVVCLIGASGCGKSTMLRCTNLLEPITYGSITMQGDVITREDADVDAIRQRIGMVFQAFNLFPHMSVLKNITLGPRKVLGLSPGEAEERARSLLLRFGLADKIDAYPDHLSGGQQQRVAIIRAIAMQPKILLLDEVTSALDPEMVREVLDVIAELKELGMTMVMATHQMGFARQIADQVVYFDRGAIVEQGAPADVLDHPREARTQAFLDRILMASG
jgi:polar amino acid transport system ATP-binding protein